MLTNQDIATLNAARTILRKLESDCQAASWNATTRAWDDGPHAADYGRVAGKADGAADAVFDAINCANVYLGLDVPEWLILNRDEPDEDGREPDGQRISEGGTIVATDR